MMTDLDYTDRQVTVNLDALGHNFRRARAMAGGGGRVMAVVKADAYGHGLEPTAQRLVAEGAAALGVGRLEEVERLRRAGLGLPMVILTGVLPSEAAAAVRLRSLPFVFNLDSAEALAAAGRDLGRRADIILKIDTGMGRLGFDLTDLSQAIDKIEKMDGLTVRGLASHLSTADETDLSHCRSQIRRFTEAISLFEDRGFELDANSMLNSAGLLNAGRLGLSADERTRLGLVRPGIMLYGCRPSQVVAPEVELTPVMTVRSRLVQIRRVPAEWPISYGRTFVTQRPTVLGVVPLGYGHGLPRNLSNTGRMLVRGEIAPIIGRVCMNLTLLDLTGLPQACEGDEVVVIGRQEDNILTAESLAAEAGIICYEALCALGGLNPRSYTSRI